MSVRLIESLATTEALAEVFSDRSVLEALLAFEVGLARAEAKVGLISEAVANAIAAAASVDSFDVTDLARQTLRGGTPGIPLVKALTERVRASAPDAAGFVHWGATSQDVADTALVLLLKKSQVLLESDLDQIEGALTRLAEQHANTVMLGRTLMQPAPPVTFGLKAAGWLSAIQRSRQSLRDAFSQALILQFGGASGTLASLGEDGIKVGRALAGELSLTFPAAPWHAHRDRLARLICSCGVLTGSLGKMARDISLLSQSEVAEVAEPGGAGRGGSSTMPHKQNPIGSAVALASAQRVPSLVATFLSAMVQEHERGLGGWQAEWPVVAEVIQATGLALASMAEVAEGLTVDPTRMRTNIEATRGVIFAERAMMIMGQKVGRDLAHQWLEEATRQTLTQQKSFAEIFRSMPEVTQHLDVETLRDLENPEKYLGVAEEFRNRLIANRSEEKD